jgi:hypothetical protein
MFAATIANAAFVVPAPSGGPTLATASPNGVLSDVETTDGAVPRK